MRAGGLDDVSGFDRAPTLPLRAWSAGLRPLLGGPGAGGLKLLACSWFAPPTLPVPPPVQVPDVTAVTDGVDLP